MFVNFICFCHEIAIEAYMAINLTLFILSIEISIEQHLFEFKKSFKNVAFKQFNTLEKQCY